MEQREPCPWRILEDGGAAFSMGAIGGSLFHAYGGFRNAPKGFTKRLYGAGTAIKQRAAITGGNFAMWGGMFSIVDCSLAYVRGKDDAWNSISSGAITGGLLAIRQGPSAMGVSACVGGLILALIEGISLGLSRMSGNMMMNEQMTAHQQQTGHN